MNIKPMGGISLIVSLGIILVHNAKKSAKVRKTIFSILIVSTIFIYLSFSLINSTNHITLNSFNLNFIDINNYENDCKIVHHDVGERNLVLRIDDIQADTWEDIQIRMINDALERDKTLSLGVIPFDILNDKELSKFLAEKRCEVEIVLHGYEHTFEEFGSLSFEEADNKIEEGLKILNKIDPNIITFIPPQNAHSKGTELAVMHNGFEVLSAEQGDNEYSATQSNYDWDNSKLRDYNSVLNGCKKDMDGNKTCVILLHPKDYVINDKLNELKYENYIRLLDGLDELNANVVNFRDLARKDYIFLN